MVISTGSSTLSKEAKAKSRENAGTVDKQDIERQTVSIHRQQEKASTAKQKGKKTPNEEKGKAKGNAGTAERSGTERSDAKTRRRRVKGKDMAKTTGKRDGPNKTVCTRYAA